MSKRYYHLLVGKNFDNQLSEAETLVSAVRSSLPSQIMGKIAIEVMRAEGSAHWRQMEWIGFWFEHIVERQVIPKTGGARGPKYGHTEFDFQRNHVWDLKVHLDGSDWLILNDQEAVNSCLDDHSGLGYLIVEGSAEFDVDGEFKSWHDMMKGGTSTYEKERVLRGATSRRRKTSFKPNRVLAIWIPSAADASKAVKDGWLKGFQEGMRNSDGNMRPQQYILVDEKF